MADAVACTRVVIRRPYVARAIGSIVVALALAMFATPALGVLPWVLLAAFTMAALPVTRRLMTATFEEATLGLEPGALRVRTRGEKPVVLRVADVRAGWELPTERVAVLELGDGREVRVAAASAADVDRVLDHARVAPEARAIAMTLRRTVGAFTIGLLAWFVTCVGGAFVGAALREPALLLAAFVAAPLAATLAVARLGRPRVIVGVDGVRTTGVLVPRFLPYAELDRIETRRSLYGGAPALHLASRDGSSVELPVVALGHAHVEAITRRIARARRAAANAEAKPVAALGRCGRSIPEWAKELERLAVAPAGFRDQALSREDFERVLADPSAPADQRVGAALALVAAEPEAARVRIRVAADATAEDDLRAALLAAADEEPDEKALDRVTAARNRIG